MTSRQVLTQQTKQNKADLLTSAQNKTPKFPSRKRPSLTGVQWNKDISLAYIKLVCAAQKAESKLGL